MIFGKTKLELKVGVFVFAGLIILLIFVLLIGDFKTLTTGYRVNFIFSFVNGVKVGAPVRFAGVDVGEVKNLNFIFHPDNAETEVEVSCLIKKTVKIPLDSSIWVNTLGLLGEKYIEIMPGKDYAVILSDGQKLRGRDPIAMHEITETARTLVGEVQDGIVRIKNGEGTLGKLLYDDMLYKELEMLVLDVKRHPWKLFWKTPEKKVSQ